jgi:hypothetical protein
MLLEFANFIRSLKIEIDIRISPSFPTMVVASTSEVNGINCLHLDIVLHNHLEKRFTVRRTFTATEMTGISDRIDIVGLIVNEVKKMYDKAMEEEGEREVKTDAIIKANGELNKSGEWINKPCAYCGRKYPKTILNIQRTMKTKAKLRCLDNKTCELICKSKKRKKK